MIHIAIVEDEALYMEQLKSYIEKFSKKSGMRFKVTCFSDGDEIAVHYSGNYDVILMDIQMKFMNGMTAAKKIREMDSKVIIIFVTNMVQYAVQGYQVDALDYIVKPVEYFSFTQKLNRAIERLEKNPQHYVSVTTENGIRKINMDDITYIESSGHYLRFMTMTETYETRGTMKYVEELLESHDFCRIHKGYLVNMKHVESVKENDCIIRGTKLPISRNNRKNFMERLTDYMGSVV